MGCYEPELVYKKKKWVRSKYANHVIVEDDEITKEIYGKVKPLFRPGLKKRGGKLNQVTQRAYQGAVKRYQRLRNFRKTTFGYLCYLMAVIRFENGAKPVVRLLMENMDPIKLKMDILPKLKECWLNLK